MLSDRLKAGMDSAAQLPLEAQEKLAEDIETILDDALWRVQLTDPRSGPVLDALIEEAKRGPILPWPLPTDLGDDAEGEE